MIRLFRLALAAVAVTTFAPSAKAETINLLRDPASGVSVSLNYLGSNITTNGGIFNWSQTGPINSNFNSALPTYCIELDQGLSSAATTFTVQTNLTAAPLIGTTSKANAITSLFDRFFNSTIGNTSRQASFQLALWEIIYDGAPSTTRTESTSGNVRFDNTLAQSFLNDIQNNAYYTNGSLAGNRLVALVNGTIQDQITVDPNPPVNNPVPAPPAVLLAGIGALALLGRSRFSRAA
jgi:hypothetical protein